MRVSLLLSPLTLLFSSLMKLFPLAALATLLASAPAAQTEVPQTTTDPRADPSVPVQRAADELRRDPTGIDTRTVTDGTGRDATVTERAAGTPAPMSMDRPTGRTGNAPMDPQMDMRAGFDRLDRDVRALGSDPAAARYSQERDAVRRDYDALGTAATPEQRMAVMTRYEDLDANVSASRMGMASRADYFRMSDARIGMYDRDLESVRMGFSSATGDDRAERAADLIRLRRQRDLYRNEVFNVRGAGQSGFDSARRTAGTTLSRVDTDFRTARRESMTRDGMGQSMQNGQMQQPGSTTGGMRN